MMLLETVPTLAVVWFALIAVLWIGFFFLEGFDFGVAMLMPRLGRTEKDRRVMINTIGPLWDGNEVWLITAIGAMFAAFPGWYSTLLSGLYLPFLLVLIGLILRGVAFEYRAKVSDPRWRRMMDTFAIVGSFLPTLVFGVAFANFVIGLPTSGQVWDGTLLTVVNPFGLLGAAMLILVCLTHGATFLALKTRGSVRDNARSLIGRTGWLTVLVVAAFVIIQNLFWPAVTEFADFGLLGWVAAGLAIVAMAASVVLTRVGRDGWAFIAGGLGVVAIFGGIFLRMYGTLGFAQDASVGAAERLNIITGASSETTLTIMSWATLVFLPIVLAYQAWSYWVFSRRISTKNIPDETGTPDEIGVAA